MSFRRLLPLILCLCLAALPAFSENAPLTVEKNEGELYFPNEKNWVYHFVYAYPRVVGEDYTSALINDTCQMALDEMAQLMLPMFANAPDMRYDGQNTVTVDFSVVCNNGRVLSILQRRVQTRGEEGPLYALEAITFDVGGLYAGETLTLRGVTLVQGGVPGEALEDVTAEAYPALAHLIDGSSGEMAAALTPLLYAEFQLLQAEGTAADHWTQADFETAFSPTLDFYTDEEGRIVFFFPPSLLSEPSFDVPVFPFTSEELDALCAEAE